MVRLPLGAALVLTLIPSCHTESGAPDSAGDVTTDAAASTGGTASGSTGGDAPTTGATSQGGGSSGSGGSSGTAGEDGFGPGPWDHGVFIPPEPQKDGDPAIGYEALLTRGYVSCGIPWALWPLAKPFIGTWAERPPLAGRTGKNAEVPYHWTVHNKNGADIVSQNCLQCHAGSFNGEIVVGLGTADFDFTGDISTMLANVWIPDIPIPGLEEFTRFLNRTKVLGPQTVMRTVGTNPAEAIAVTLVAHRDRHTLEWFDEPQLPLPNMVLPSDPPPWWRVTWYNESFYGQVTRMEPSNPFPGYMAPPLDGVWATGPFLHNGSVPTIELVLNSTKRPKYWKRVDFDSKNFDEDALGWPYVELPYGQAQAPADEQKFVYDTTFIAHFNTGHTFGDHLTDDERRAVLEYLKTL